MSQTTRRNILGGALTTGVAAALGPLNPMQACAAAPPAGKQVPGIYRYKVGDFEVTSVNDGFTQVAKLDAMVVNAPLAEIEKTVEDAFIPKDNVRVPFSPLLVNTGRNVVLLDTGFGDNGSPMTGHLLNNLAAAGVDPKDIDTVIISHFHADHISGLRAKSGAATFPNAQILVPQAEWAYWNDAGEMSRAPQGVWKGYFENVKRVFDPIAKDVTRFEYGKELVPGIASVDARGHSPGHTAFVIASGNARLMYSADVITYPAIFARRPEWLLWADQMKDLALHTRRKLLDMLATDRMLMTGYHCPFPGVGHIARRGAGYEFVLADWQPLP